MPALAGADPGDVRRVPIAAQTTIGSSALATTCTSGCAASAVAPQLRHHRDLLGPVELVAAEVEQRDDARRGLVDHLGEVVLVDLQHGVRRVRRPWPAPRCARWACWRRRSWWRPAPSTPSAAAVSRVVVVLPLVPETRAICAAGGEVGQQVGVDLQADPAADHRAVAAPAARDSAAAVRDTEVATLARRGIFASVTRARLPDDL